MTTHGRRATLLQLPLGLALVLPMPFLMKHWGWLESMRWWPLFDLLSGAATACVLVAGAIREGGPVRSLFELRPLVVVGRFSYSLYLIHAPLLQILWQYVTVPAGLGSAATFAFLMTAGTLLITLISWLFHLAFEAPFMKASRVTPAGAPAIAR